MSYGGAYGYDPTSNWDTMNDEHSGWGEADYSSTAYMAYPTGSSNASQTFFCDFLGLLVCLVLLFCLGLLGLLGLPGLLGLLPLGFPGKMFVSS